MLDQARVREAELALATEGQDARPVNIEAADANRRFLTRTSSCCSWAAILPNCGVSARSATADACTRTLMTVRPSPPTLRASWRLYRVTSSAGLARFE